MTWLTGWDKRIKITIDNNKINSGLSDFPLLIKLSNKSGINSIDVTEIFDELSGTSNKKIAITTETGIQCYVEIESWDWINKEAYLWVKVPAIMSNSKTVLYFYYDSTQEDNTTYIGDSASLVAQNVWDSHFKGVWHLNQFPIGSNSIKDSTVNNNDGTPYGTMTSGDLVTGMVGKALDFDGNDDYIDCGTDSSLVMDATFTEMALVYSEFTDTDYHAIVGYQPSTPSSRSPAIYVTQTTKISAGFGDGNGWNSVSTGDVFNENSWNLVTATFDGTNYKIYINDEEKVNSTSLSGKTPTNTPIRNIGYIDNYWDGKIGFVAISDINRSGDWIKAFYHSIDNNLIYLGLEEFITYENWPYNWLYRKQHIIKAASKAGIGYQIRIVVHYGSGTDSGEDVYLNGKCKYNFGDVRFTSSDGVTELAYWMESKINNDKATFWVKIDDDLSDNDVTIYIYYGNYEEEYKGDGRSTFLIFEDMESEPSGKLFNNAYYDSVNKYVRLTTATDNVHGELDYEDINLGIVIDWKHWTGGGDGADASYLYINTTVVPDYEDYSADGYIFAVDEYQDQLQVNFNGSNLSTVAQSNIDNSTWHSVRVIMYGSGTSYYYKFYYDDFNTAKIDSSSTNDPLGIHFGWGARTGGANNVHKIKDLMVRKYTYPEPEHGEWGNEEVRYAGYFSGNVVEHFNIAISGAELYLYKQSDGTFLNSTVSSGNGGFYITTVYSGAHFLVCLPTDSLSESYNALIYYDLYPITISG